MTVESIMAELEAKGSAGTKKVLLKHGIQEPFFGVKVQDLKVIQKRIKKDYQLSKDLFATGNADAMYLAGLIADEQRMTRKDLSAWVKAARSTNVSEYTVPWIAAESNHGWDLALEWIDAKEDRIVASGWATLSSLVAITQDADLDIPALKALLQRVEKTIQMAGNRVRYTMNGFIISVGAYVTALTDDAMATAKRIGEVSVNVGDTACKVPMAVEYIQKIKARGSLGKKKKMARC